MEARTIQLNSIKAELVTRFATRALRENELNQREEDAARELRTDIIDAETVTVLG